ncbi:dihydrolipoamide acetyltransferase family protein [Actinophytocola sp. NPDC049390]|uniref:dihydrolipoamide acetyltransferase family protein n=1 Tax=Actinophytocola sp. NPDC049390 TaxID=3363894 RepID=UPI0037A7DE22
MAEFRMPSLGADMDQGTVVEWLVKPGDAVRRGDVVAVVDTAKAAVEVECFDSGIVERLLVDEGATVPVGTPLAVITEKAPATVPERPAEKPAPPQAAEPAPVPAAMPAPRVPPPVARPAVTPIIRKLAGQAGIDLSTVHGSGRGGAITRHDLESVLRHRTERQAVTPYARRLAAELGVDLTALGPGPVKAADVRAAAPRRQPPVEKPTPARDMRGAIAELMTRANRDIPHYHLATTVDLGPLMEWLHDHNRTVPVVERLVPAAFLLKATASAAAEVGELNGHWRDGAFHPASTVDLGVATSLRGGGLIVPVLPDAAHLPVTELMRLLRDRVARVRAGHPRGSDLAPASITVTNLGDLGVELVHGVIHPPQVALVGFGTVVDRPWAVGGMVGVRPVVTVTLAADHRATDGATGGRFLRTLARNLQRPEDLR